ncbi:MAG: porin family protein [Chlorobiaceae bacterium]|nr:porin family protein [Chlorobiaceae bacterium]
MKATKALVAAGLAVMLGAGTAMAVEGPNVGKVSIGYQGMNTADEEGNWGLNGVSARYWINNTTAIEGNFFYGTDSEEDPYDTDEWSTVMGTVKVLYAPVVKANSRFYVGLQGGLGSFNFEDPDEDESDTFWMVEPLVGFEYNFPGLTEIGFNAEVGYSFYSETPDNSWTTEDNESGIAFSFGAHYYF